MGNLEKNIGQTITIAGKAREAKGGPVLITDSGEVIYIEDLVEWPDHQVNKYISVKGILKKGYFIPPARIDEGGGISSGASGQQYSLQIEQI